MSIQNDIESLKDLMHRNQLTAAEANVQLVLIQRFRLITNGCHRDVRSALNSAVKSGVLGHKKKDGHKPECYYHPTFEFLAAAARNKHESDIIRACKNIAGWHD